MHSFRREIHPALVALVGIIATALALLTTAQDGVALWYAGEQVPWLGLFKARAVDWYACALFVPLLIALVRRYPIDRPRWPHHLPILLLAAVPVAVAKEAVFAAVGNVFRPGLFDLATILSEDLSYEVMAVWAMLAVCHLLIPQPEGIPCARPIGRGRGIRRADPKWRGTGRACRDRVRRRAGQLRAPRDVGRTLSRPRDNGTDGNPPRRRVPASASQRHRAPRPY